MHSAPTWPNLSAQAARPAPVLRAPRAPTAHPAPSPGPACPCRAPACASLPRPQIVLQYKLPLLLLPSGHNTLGVLQYTSLPFKQLQSRYNVCIVTQPAFLANLPLLQYNCHPTSYIAIHLSPRLQYNSNPLHTKLQYNPSYCMILPALQAPIAVTIQYYLYCDTMPMLKWAVAHSFNAQKFFFHYSLFVFLFICSNHWNIKLYTYIFFSFSIILK